MKTQEKLCKGNCRRLKVVADSVPDTLETAVEVGEAAVEVGRTAVAGALESKSLCLIRRFLACRIDDTLWWCYGS